VVSYLTEELVRQGHDVTLFASGDSKTAANLVRCCDMALRLNPISCTTLKRARRSRWPHSMFIDAPPSGPKNKAARLFEFEAAPQQFFKHLRGVTLSDAPRLNKRRRYIRAVFGPKDRRFPKRDPEIEAMYPGHCIPSSPLATPRMLRCRGLSVTLI
jgi:hypothetical protein